MPAPIGSSPAVAPPRTTDDAPTPIISIKSTLPPQLALNTPGKQPAVFLDRDGVINSARGFVNTPEDLDRLLIPSSIKAIARMSKATPVKLVVVTNQGGVGDGYMTDDMARAILARLAQRVKEAGGRLDAIYYAPNSYKDVTPQGEISARKPEGGMLLKAAEAMGPAVDLADSFMVGDMPTDFGAGKSASNLVTTVGVRTGFSSVDVHNPNATKPDVTFDNLSAFADWFTATYGKGMPTGSADEILASARAFQQVPQTLSAVVDRSQKQLLLKVSDLDDDLTDRLLMAKERGVDVRVVWASEATLDQYQVQRVLALTDSGVDLKVTRSSKLPERAGVADGVAFAASKADPVVPEKPPVFDSDTKLAAERASTFQTELTDPVTNTDRGLLPPGQIKLHTFPDENAGVIINAIRAAKQSIDLEVYQLTDRGVIDALKEAAKRGVKVRVMVEPRALEPSNFDVLGKELKEAGIELRSTPAAFDHNKNVDHAKFMVVDDQELLFGTGNLVRVGLGGNEHREANTRDFWVEDTRPAPLKEARTLFDADWDQKPTDPSMFPTLTVTPDDVASDLKALISSATKRVYVSNQSLSDPDMITQLIEAKKRGCDVKVLLGAFQDNPRKAPSNEAALQQLKAAGIEAQYLTGMYLHAKAIIADDQAFVGSQNFTAGGLVRNREVGAVYDDQELVAGVLKAFNEDWANPGPQPIVPPPPAAATTATTATAAAPPAPAPAA